MVKFSLVIVLIEHRFLLTNLSSVNKSFDADVIVIGAGLAGLRCAQVLTANNLSVLLIESNDYVGGRLRSFAVDGYIIDQGFQLINPSYPELIQSGVLKEFDLRTYDPGIEFRENDSRFTLSDPRAGALASLQGIRKSSLPFRDILRIGKVLAGSYLSPARQLMQREDTDTFHGLRAAGISENTIRTFFQPFLRGTFLDDELATSWNYARLILKSFAKASPGTHPEGIQALPQAFARDLPLSSVLLNTKVTRISENKVSSTNGDFSARAIVLATDGSSAAQLLPSTPPQWRSQTTWWWSAPKQTDSSALRIDLSDRLLCSALDISSRAPERSPKDCSLIATPMIGNQPTLELEQRARASVAHLYEINVEQVQLITTTIVEKALPALAPPFAPKFVNENGTVFCAGDYLESPSIQGALHSGAKSAHAVRAALHSSHRSAMFDDPA